jgi:hypothetical protein
MFRDKVKQSLSQIAGAKLSREKKQHPAVGDCDFEGV